MMLTDAQKAQAKELWETTEKTASEIAELVGGTKNSIIGLADRGKWWRFSQARPLSETQKKIIELRKTTDLSLTKIGEQLKVTKNVVQGVICREAPELTKSMTKASRTLFDRCDALHARMNAVLAECDKPGLRIPGSGNQYPNIKLSTSPIRGFV